MKSERSTFYMCRLSVTNREYRKYPPLPVWRCTGHQPRDPDAVEGGDKLIE